MYSNLESDEGKRREVISALYWSLMQNWNIPQSIQDYYGFSEDYRLYHQLEDMDSDVYNRKREAGEVPDILEVDARDRKSTRLNSSHQPQSRMPSSA